jgi:hypothetical protein
MRSLKLRPALAGFGLTMIGPLLLHDGSEEQKREHLPPIVRGEIRWCQGYSEPGAGSDLAGLQTRAVADGDDFIIDGQKIWTTYADKADWMFLLVRTDPNAAKHAGISFILMDMSSPGVAVRPIQLISGYSPFCETFLQDVRVPRKNVVGKVNGGWPIAKTLLGFERTMIADAFLERDDATGTDRVVDLARRYVGPAEGPIDDPLIRESRPTPGAGDLDLQVLRHRAEQAPPRAVPVDPRTAGARLGGRRVRAPRGQAHARMVALARQLDRRRHLGDPAQHHRQARARLAGLKPR